MCAAFKSEEKLETKSEVEEEKRRKMYTRKVKLNAFLINAYDPNVFNDSNVVNRVFLDL